ncbi:FecR family protein [Olivibacter sitiensis]|uniref:FecR family protein n=1 Tax=Olivibacter sitiensis TaxID=376470 RepID=UPI0004127A57|nr:FecR family protein [Olivibacter sitiensis]
MSNNDAYINELFRKYLECSISKSELDELLDHFGDDEYSDLLRNLIREQFNQPVPENMDNDRLLSIMGRMDNTVLQETRSARPWPISRWLPYAAAILLILATTITWLHFGEYLSLESKAVDLQSNDIAPGGNRATLTLADGRTINLSMEQSGIVINDGSITYQDGAMSVLRLDERETSIPLEMLTLTTPRGGQYQITLSDGSKIWLNAASQLKYPSRFKGKDRVVELSGEAFFQIVKQKGERRPFKVISRGQQVEVLGTQFNISAYADEGETRTTLVAGRVKVSADKDSALLNPGDQATYQGEAISVKQVNTSQYTAWKEGFFYFNGHSPQEAFEQLGRWYDINVVYRRKVPIVQFFGKVERNKSLGSLLNILQTAGFEFDVVSSGDAITLIVGKE